MTDLAWAANEVGSPLPTRPEEFRFVRYRVENGVAWLTLHHPDYNLLNEQMLAELAVGIDHVGEQPEIKLVVLDSAAKAFCGGIEISEYSPPRVFQVLDAFHRAFLALLDTAKPLVVVVNGPAIGGGAELAALGDIVVATPRASFAQPEIKLGAFPPLATVILPHIIGPKLALELVLTGDAITAERARNLGLVNRLVPEEQLQATVNELIQKVAAQSGPVLMMAKKAILGGMGLSLREGVRNSIRIFLNELASLEDSQEGWRALLERRAPQWKNR